MANVNVSYEEMTRVANSLGSGRDDIIAKLDNLKHQINSLITNGFVTDKTSGAFSAAYDRFTNGAKTTVNGLNDVIGFMKKVETTLRDADAKLASAIG